MFVYHTSYFQKQILHKSMLIKVNGLLDNNLGFLIIISRKVMLHENAETTTKVVTDKNKYKHCDTIKLFLYYNHNLLCNGSICMRTLHQCLDYSEVN